MNNYAVYATRLDDENARDASRIQLDEMGNVINPTNPWGNPWAAGAIRDAQDGRAWLVMRDAMTFLDSVIGEDRDSSTVNAFNQATSKIKDAAHAEKLIEKLQIAALNGSEAALIGIVAASIYINRYAFVDFGWYVSAEEMADMEGFAVDLRVAHDMPATELPHTGCGTGQILTQPATEDLTHDLDFSIEGMEADDDAAIVISQPAPLALIVPVAQPAAPALPSIIITPLIIRADGDRILTATATGWQAESASVPGTFHTTAEDGSRCTCPGSRRWGKCWHRTAVYAHRKHERDTALPIDRPRKRGRAKMWK